MQSDRDIYEAIGGDLVRLATVLVGPDEAPDVVSRVVARRLTRGPLSELEEPRQYLMRAVVNEAKNVHRSRSRQSVAYERVGPLADIDDMAESHFPDVTEAVMSLPERQRAAVFLVYWLGFAPTDAARVLRCRPGTVRRYLTIALRKIEEALDD